MKIILNTFAIASGIIGLGAIALNGTPLTAENAPLHIARVVTVLAFVIIPYIIARAIEQMNLAAASTTLVTRLQNQFQRSRQPVVATQGNTGESPAENSSQTLFFDYLFSSTSANNSEATSRMELPTKSTLTNKLKRSR